MIGSGLKTQPFRIGTRVQITITKPEFERVLWRPDPSNTGLIPLIGDSIVTVQDPGIYCITNNRSKKGNSGSQNSQLITTNFKEQILTASWIPAAVKFATTVAGSREGSRRRRPGGLGTAAAGMAGLAAGAAATAAAVLLAAANSALTLSAIADSLSPIRSIICSKNITGSFRSRKTFKNAVEKHCVNGSQKFAECGRKIYTDICGFYAMLTGGFS